MRRELLVSAVALACAAPVMADKYSVEVNAGYGTGEIDLDAFDVDLTVWNLGGSYYVWGADDSKGPLAEAAFLDRSTTVFANYTNTEFEAFGNDFDIDSYNVGGLLIDKESGWFGGIAYTKDDSDGDDGDTWELTGGKYLAQYTTLSATYTSSEVGSDDTDDFNVDVKHVAQLAGASALAITGGIGYSDSDVVDDTTTVGVGVTYYLDSRIGFGAGTSLASSDDSDVVSFELHGSWFPVSNIGLYASYAISEDDDNDVDTDLFLLQGVVRF